VQVSPTGTAAASGSITSLDGNPARTLEDQFMAILLTQLRYQDPMEPMKEKDFFAQMAQFATATRVDSLSQNLMSWLDSMAGFMRGSALVDTARLIGHSFTAETDGERLDGIIQSVALSGGRIVIRWQDREIPIESVTSIGGTVNAG